MEKNFSVGELIVYPAHGIGVVQGVENQEISGVELKVLVILFSRDKMTVRLPINKNTMEKIRKLSSESEMNEAIEYLRKPVKVKKTMWSRRAQEYESKINSGIPLSIAQVIRDLHRSATQPEHSYSERKIYQEALDRLMREYAAVAKIDEKLALEKLENVLNEAA